MPRATAVPGTAPVYPAVSNLYKFSAVGYAILTSIQFIAFQASFSENHVKHVHNHGLNPLGSVFFYHPSRPPSARHCPQLPPMG